MFDTVDVTRSQCYLESDRQKLLGIIEVGFGDVADFNAVLRHVFKREEALDKFTASGGFKGGGGSFKGGLVQLEV